MFDIFGLKALTARLSAVESRLSKKIEQLEQQNRDLQHKVEELQGLETLIKKAIEKNPELLVKLYDVNKLEQKLVEAVNAQLGNVN